MLILQAAAQSHEEALLSRSFVLFVDKKHSVIIWGDFVNRHPWASCKLTVLVTYFVLRPCFAFGSPLLRLWLALWGVMGEGEAGRRLPSPLKGGVVGAKGKRGEATQVAAQSLKEALKRFSSFW